MGYATLTHPTCYLLDEYTFRYNNRIKLGVDDDMRAARAIKGADGKRLTYRGL